MIPVACAAGHLGHFHVGDVGKVDAVRLSGIGKPRDLFSLCHVVLEELLLFRGFTQREPCVIVTFHALFQPRDPRKGTVSAEGVTETASFQFSTALYAFGYLRVQMKQMAEVDRLLLA